MTDNIRSPAELRNMFGANLKRLAKQYPTVSELCRQLGINRTQFNRYLGGESFPRPEVLDRICRFFDVDARILLKPLDDIAPPQRHPAAASLAQFLGSAPVSFPAGFFRSTETVPDKPELSRQRLLYARRLPQCTVIRSYEPRAAMPGASPQEREIQGMAACAGQKTYILMSRRNAVNSQMYLVAPPSDDNPAHWCGLAINLSDVSVDTNVTRRIVLQHLGDDYTVAIASSREINRALLLQSV